MDTIIKTKSAKPVTVLLIVLLELAMTVHPGTADAAWSLMNDKLSVQAVWGTSETNVYAMGCLGQIAHYDGNAEGDWSLFDPIQGH